MNHSHGSAKTQSEKELSKIVVDCGYQIHVHAKPGLLESVDETVLTKMGKGIKVKRWKIIPANIMGLKSDEAFRVDRLIEGSPLIEIRSVENLKPAHTKQTITYFKPLNLPLSLLLDFGAATFKESCKRIVNGNRDFVASCLCVNQ